MRPPIAVALVVLAAVFAGAGSNIETPHLTATLSAGSAAVSAGGRVSLFVDVTPKPKMHVYSPQQKELIPISITIEPAPAFRAGAPVFPAPEKYFFAPLKETQLVYSKPFRIVQPLTLASAAALRSAGYAPGSTIAIAGKIRYQACDDAICYLPKEVPVSWTLTVKATGARVQ
jgi:DsbC/DsbD-like thiol-disulfide interchange protein